MGCVTMRSAQPPPEAIQPLPFKGKLFGVSLDDAPPAIAASVSDNSPIAFSYREELSHDHHTVPMMLSAFNPLTYLGASTGSTSVTAFADLSISNGDRLIGDYTATAYVVGDYSLYSGETYFELDRDARARVRHEIDNKVYDDLDRLTRELTTGRQQP
jgi:hypothetical protein